MIDMETIQRAQLHAQWSAEMENACREIDRLKADAARVRPLLEALARELAERYSEAPDLREYSGQFQLPVYVALEDLRTAAALMEEYHAAND